MLVYVGFSNSPSVVDSAANNKVVSPKPLRVSVASMHTDVAERLLISSTL